MDRVKDIAKILFLQIGTKFERDLSRIVFTAAVFVSHTFKCSAMFETEKLV